jgi:cobalt/nickel transport system ATP-binding protein
MTALLRLDSVTVSRGGRTILREVSLDLRAGEKLALVGANGAGKTTLLRTWVGLEKPQSGKVIAFGAECRDEKDFRPVRARAGLLFQDPDDQLFSPTVIEDVAFGPLNLGLSQKDAVLRAHETLESLGLAHLSRRMPHRLSGGEKRLVSLAAVLSMKPDALLLDEPTNALDDIFLARLTEILQNLDIAMVVVSHDRHFLEKLATRAALLRDGRLTPATLHSHAHTHDHPHIHAADGAHAYTHAGSDD